MITKERILQKITSILILLSIISCTSLKTKSQLDSKLMGNIIDNYLKEYKEYKSDNELQAITIYIRKDKTNNLTVSIFDTPIEVIVNEIDNDKITGEYTNIAFQLYGLSNLDSKSLLKNTNFKFSKKYKNINDYPRNHLIEWEPMVSIKYDFKNNSKIIKYFDGREINKNYKN